MKQIFNFLILSLVLISCQMNSPTTEIDDTPQNEIRYAENLRILKTPYQVTMEILSPESKTVEHTLTFELGKPRLERLAVLSSTHVGMLGKLNRSQSIVGISNANYVGNDQLLKRIKNNQVIELGEETQIPVESIINSKCQAIVYSGFGKEFPHQKQLKKIGIECLANYDWRENHPLGKAEWILFFGYLTGTEEAAKAYFKNVEAEYKRLSTVGTKADTHPNVISGHMWGESWNAPAGESFHAQLLRDAGANYVYSNTKGTGSIQISMEKVITENETTEFWLNTGLGTMDEILRNYPKLEYLQPIKKNKVYDYSLSGNKYWEESAVDPHCVLADYIRILHPNLNGEINKEGMDSTLYFYHQVK